MSIITTGNWPLFGESFSFGQATRRSRRNPKKERIYGIREVMKIEIHVRLDKDSENSWQ
jgi:hypothetical protein